MDNSIQVLRGQLEARLAAPAVIVVTSARANDGKSLTAFSLATSFAEAGYRSIVVDANPSRPQLSRLRPIGDTPVDRIDVASHAVQNVRGGHHELLLATEKDAHLLSRPQIKTVLDQCRLCYEYTVVDCSDFQATGLPALLAKYADAALISAREGRRCTELDSRLVQSVEESGAPVFGVVLVPKAVMDGERAAEKQTAASSNGRSRLIPVEQQASAESEPIVDFPQAVAGNGEKRANSRLASVAKHMLPGIVVVLSLTMSSASVLQSTHGRPLLGSLRPIASRNLAALQNTVQLLPPQLEERFAVPAVTEVTLDEAADGKSVTACAAPLGRRLC